MLSLQGWPIATQRCGNGGRRIRERLSPLDRKYPLPYDTIVGSRSDCSPLPVNSTISSRQSIEAPPRVVNMMGHAEGVPDGERQEEEEEAGEGRGSRTNCLAQSAKN